jgi:hypothetical protein
VFGAGVASFVRKNIQNNKFQDDPLFKVVPELFTIGVKIPSCEGDPGYGAATFITPVHLELFAGSSISPVDP